MDELKDDDMIIFWVVLTAVIQNIILIRDIFILGDGILCPSRFWSKLWI